MEVRQELDYKSLLQRVYDSFNDRDIDRALEVIHPEVDWANSMEGGFLQGHDALREYWLRLWSYTDPHFKVIEFTRDEEGHMVVEANQIMRDISRIIISIRDVKHIFRIEDGLITSMRVE